MIVQLNDNEWSSVTYLAEKRTNKEQHKISDKPQSKIDMEGVGGEFAFCKVFNVYPDFRMNPGQYDARMPNGTTVDVKTTACETGHLIGQEKKLKYPTDVYFLVIMKEEKEFETVGWATKGDLFDESNYLDHFGRGKCFAIPQENLRNERELWKYSSS